MSMYVSVLLYDHMLGMPSVGHRQSSFIPRKSSLIVFKHNNEMIFKLSVGSIKLEQSVLVQ